MVISAADVERIFGHKRRKRVKFVITQNEVNGKPASFIALDDVGELVSNDGNLSIA